MTFLLALLQGAGCSAAVGVRPFLPALLVGALASADVGVDFDGTDFQFLEAPWFLFVLVVGFGVTTFGRRYFETGVGDSAVQGLSVGLGAVECAGALDDVSGTWWPGLIVGAACAVIGLLASRDLMGRVKGRLDAESAGTLFLYAEGFALALAGLSVLAPPIGLLGVAFLIWLLLGGRRREGEKYAGLRSLR